jgi:hypothetical protein
MSPAAILVPAQHIRRLFNEGNYKKRLDSGELQAVLRGNRHPASPRAKMPVCTRSQTVVYLTRSGKVVAIVHQYLLPNGEIGASGKPDPKYLVHNGRVYQAF